MNLEATIPEEWLKILAGLKQECNEPSMFLVGGAVRDLVLDKPVKDLDVFCTEFVDVPHYFKPIGELQFEVYKPSKRLDRAYTANILGWEVNLVICTKRSGFMDILEDFDFGICQIGIHNQAVDYGCYEVGNINYQILYTKAFLDDVNNKTLTITNKKFSRESHTNKMKAKFPDYTLVED